jgi:hypothetical protein
VGRSPVDRPKFFAVRLAERIRKQLTKQFKPSEGLPVRLTGKPQASRMNTPTTNNVFNAALLKHVDACKSDIRSFPLDATPDGILQEIKKDDEERQASRGCR